MVKVTVDRSYIWKPGGDIILDPLSRMDGLYVRPPVCPYVETKQNAMRTTVTV